MKVREEIHDPVDMGDGNIRPARQSVQLLGRQVAELALNRSQLVEYQDAIIRPLLAMKEDDVTGLSSVTLF
jgi:hypothetical protein